MSASEPGSRREFVVTLVVALLGAFLLRAFVLQVFFIPTPSMVPTLLPGDRVAVEKLSYHFGPLERGDVVVFDAPAGSTVEGHLVKRVVALPGETVQGVGGEVLVDGDPLEEPWLGEVDTSPFPSTEVPAGEVWVMGDNRDNSGDSRVFGPVSVSSVVGRAFVLIWPLDRLGTLGGS